MTMLRVVIADDEPLALERLSHALRSMPDVTLVGSATNGRDALALIAAERPDVALLDIQMPAGTGLDVAAALGGEASRPDIVFLTAFDRHAVDAFDLDATDYLLKPLNIARLRQALERVRRRRGASMAADVPISDAKGFWVQGRQGMTHVPLDDIQWIEAAKDYVLLHTRTRAHIVRATMQSIEAQFDAATLMRVHRSALVRPGAVRALHAGASGATLVLEDDVGVAVGPSHLHRVREVFGGLGQKAR